MTSDRVPVPLRALDTTPADSVRAGERDPLVVAAYADALSHDPRALPPVRVFAYRRGKAWHYYLADGGYRLAALKLARPEAAQIESELTECLTGSDALAKAVAFACRANADHGVRRTWADSRAAVLAALARPELEGFSGRQIAKYCRVSHTLANEVIRANLAIGNPGCADDGSQVPSSAPEVLAGQGVTVPDTPGDPQPDSDAPGAATGSAATLPVEPYTPTRPPTPVTDVPRVGRNFGREAVADRDKFESAVRALRLAESAVLACFGGLAGVYLRTAVEPPAGRVPQLRDWIDVLGDCQPDEHACFACHGEGCSACGHNGFACERLRALRAVDSDDAGELFDADAA